MTLLLALLLCAPERVAIVARRAEKASVLSRVEAGLGSAWKRLFQAEDGQAGEANALAAQGDAQGALKLYDAAKARLPESPALAFDRSGALLKLPDPSAAAQAAGEAARALDKGDPALKAQAAYQLALATEAMGQPEEAMKLYASALALDPDDPDSKVNLELLLRTQEERQQQQQSGQPRESPRKKDQPQQSPDKSKGQQPQGQDKQAGDQEQKKQDDARPQPGTEQQAREKEKRPQEAEQKPVDRSEAERLLDALRASEKNLQVWRFAKDKRKEAHRGEAEKDW